MVYVLIIAIILIYLFLWLHRVWKTMQKRQCAIKTAAEHLAIIQKRSNEPLFESELKQSENNYVQAVRLYHLALENPFNWLPATLMGFRHIKENKI